MKKSYIIWIVVVVLALVIIGSYNSLVGANEVVNKQWALVDAQYQRRMDLIPNLISSAKAVMKQELAVFTAIADARTKYAGARNIDEKIESAKGFDSAISRLLVIQENYPELKSDKAVASVMAELAGTENRINVERSRFDEVVQTYNLKVKRFPGSILASLFGYKEHEYFKSEAGAEKAPSVNF